MHSHAKTFIIGLVAACLALLSGPCTAAQIPGGCEFEVQEVLCNCNPDGGIDGYSVSINVINNSGVAAHWVLLPGFNTVPNIMALNPPLEDGDSRKIDIDIVDVDPGEFCFYVVLADSDVEECCSGEVCVDLPDCDCFQILEQSVECVPDAFGPYTLTFTFQNLTEDVIFHAFLLAPDGITVTPDYIAFDEGLAHCDSAEVSVTVSGAEIDELVCILFTIHNENLVECCADTVCSVAPDCSPDTNDNCEDRFEIFDGATDYSTIGANTDGLPHAACMFDGQTYQDVWYNYTATCTGTLTVSTCGTADYDTDLVVYSGCDVCPPGDDELLGCNDDTPGCDGFTSEVVVDVVAGECYKIRVGGWNVGDEGNGTLTISCEEASVCGPGNGDCSVPNGTPGCDDVECCKIVCGLDPFCCDTEWDQICADSAATNCPQEPDCGVPGTGSCFEANGTPYCDDAECCDIVCSLDPFCCDSEWDQICADSAAKNCGGPPAGCCDGSELLEGEACGDDTNGGCNSDPNAFTPAACGDVFCGDAWADGGMRDTDWYLVSHPGGLLTGTLESQFAGVVFIVDGIATCVPAIAGETGASVDCVPGTASADLPAGDYVVFVAPADFEGTPCDSGNNEYRLTIGCDGGPPSSNDACEDRFDIFDGPTDYSTLDATTDGLPHEGGVCQYDGQTYNDIWYNYVASCDGFLTVTTCDTADYDTDLVVYSGCDVCPPGDDELLGCNDDDPACTGFTSTVVVPVVAGNCYKIRVGGWNASDAGTGTVTLTCVPGAAGAECFGDLDGDFNVGAGDLSVMLSAWGSNASPADLNEDRIVDSADLALLLSNWGSCK